MRRLTTTALALALAGCGADEHLPPQQRAALVLEEALSHENNWVRAETVRLLADAEFDAAKPQIRAALDDADPLVESSAVNALLRMGDSEANERALTGLMTGSDVRRLELLEDVVHNTRGRFRSEALARSLRDPSAVVRLRALDHCVQMNLEPDVADINRLVRGEDREVRQTAFRVLVRLDREAALAMVLTDLRGSDGERRDDALSLSRYLAVPSLWPTMRSFATHGDDAQRGLALLVLGHLGDPWAETSLVSVISTGAATEAAAAASLIALARIPTSSAQARAMLYRRDPRPEVRAAAFEALRHVTAPPVAFEPFLIDDDSELGQRAFGYLQERDPLFAAEAFSRSLTTADDPVMVLRSLYSASQTREVRPLIEQVRPRLEALARQPNPEAADLALRLLLTVSEPSDLLSIAQAARAPGPLYAVLEACARADDPQWSALFTQALDHDLFALRVAGAIGISQLGDRYAPPSDS
ncbi:MAG: HEAT repeat protein [Bradymonadia bacterium]|jgi:HEAT repeat protein